jgi:hypothetical protein
MINPATKITTEIKITLNNSILLSLKEKKRGFHQRTALQQCCCSL